MSTIASKTQLTTARFAVDMMDELMTTTFRNSTLDTVCFLGSFKFRILLSDHSIVASSGCLQSSRARNVLQKLLKIVPPISIVVIRDRIVTLLDYAFNTPSTLLNSITVIQYTPNKQIVNRRT